MDSRASHCRRRRPRLQQNRYSQIENQPVARRGADPSQLVHDRAHHSVAIMGKTISPIEPSETMHTLQKGFVNAGFIFFALAILATLIFGRFVCDRGCHILALQDLCGWLLKKMGLHPKPFRSRLLVYIPLTSGWWFDFLNLKSSRRPVIYS